VEPGRTYFFRVSAAPGAGDPGRPTPYTLSLALTGREAEPNNTPATAQLVAPGITLTGAIAPGDPDVFRIDPPVGGRFVAQLRSTGATTRLSLLDSLGRLLTRTDGPAKPGAEVRLDLHVDPGPLFLKVESLRGAAGYTLSTALTPAATPTSSGSTRP